MNKNSLARARRGTALIETLVSMFVMSLVITATLGLVSTGTRSADRQTLEAGLAAQARTSLDEVLREVRGAEQVVTTFTNSGATFTSGTANLVVKAPAYDGAGILSNVYDVVAYRYDANAGTLTQTTVVSNGSQRPVRSGLVIAEHVTNVAYTYSARDQKKGDGAQTAFEMAAQPNATPTVYVNGVVKTTGLSYSASSKTVTFIAAPAAGDDIQFVYSVSPTEDSGKWLAYVIAVSVTLTVRDTDGRNVQRTVTLNGNAQMRNSRA